MNTIPQPSTKSLVLSSFISLILAVIVFVIAVLPAEFHRDPTGLGHIMGLLVLSESNAIETQQPNTLSCPTEEGWQDSVLISIPAHKGLEYKFNIKQGEAFEFSWQTQQGDALYFDFHGDPEGAKNGYFKRYKESTQSQFSGSLSAPFTGKHGWYWENKTAKTVIIQLKTRGNYQIIGVL